jgi:hypothetical protein
MKVDRLDACPAQRVVGAVLVVSFSSGVGVKSEKILQTMGSKGRYLKQSTKPCWPLRSKESWTKYTPLLSQRKLALTARNTLFVL